MTIQGNILHLQRFSTEDGPGIRTTVFLKGCPLHCTWCHNPESISLQPQVQWLENHCIGCQTCLKACPQHALHLNAHGLERNWNLCQGCGACAEVCPANAQELLGHSVSVSTLLKELLKDRAYFEKSTGGVTLSGGEPSLQADFVLALTKSLRAAGIHVALDTCGLCTHATLLQLVAESDLILYDLKLLDVAAHRQYTGADNARILENLIGLGDYLTAHPLKKLWVRTPLIPNATYTQDNLLGIGNWLSQHLPQQVERWELCAFNNLCRDKYRRLGLTWDYATVPLLTKADLQQAADWARSSGYASERIVVTGATRVEN